MLARGAFAIREVVAGRLDPTDALSLTVWPTPAVDDAMANVSTWSQYWQADIMRGDFYTTGTAIRETKECRGCGTPIDSEPTYGCKQCSNRATQRHRRHEAQAA